jgi:hypothetical protein
VLQKTRHEQGFSSDDMRMYEQQRPATTPHKTRARATLLAVERGDSLNQKKSESNVHGMQRGDLQSFWNVRTSGCASSFHRPQRAWYRSSSRSLGEFAPPIKIRVSCRLKHPVAPSASAPNSVHAPKTGHTRVMSGQSSPTKASEKPRVVAMLLGLGTSAIVPRRTCACP